MKKIIIYSIIILLMGLKLQAQTALSDKNYVHITIPQTPLTITDLSGFSCSNTLKPNNTIENVTYFDGLGRPVQEISIKASPNKKDIITHLEYDEFGRQSKQYLPFEAQKDGKGSYQTGNIQFKVKQYYKNRFPNDFPGPSDGIGVSNTNPYSESIFDNSPLNRVVEQGFPGTAWKADPDSETDHTIKYDIETNTAKEVVRFKVIFENNNTEKPKLVQDGFYDSNQLYVSIAKDENWNPKKGKNGTTREYKNKQGQVILKRNHQNYPHNTFYVYDDFGNLTYVLPPKADTRDGISDIELSELCYQYKYDYRNRLIEKKIPGKGWEYIVYNKLNQPIMTQDAKLKTENSWSFIM